MTPNPPIVPEPITRFRPILSCIRDDSGKFKETATTISSEHGEYVLYDDHAKEVSALQIRLAEVEKERDDLRQLTTMACSECDDHGLIYHGVTDEDGNVSNEEPMQCPSCDGTRLGNYGSLKADLSAAVKALAEQRQATFDQIEDKHRIGYALMAKLDAAVKAREEIAGMLRECQPLIKRTKQYVINYENSTVTIPPEPCLRDRIDALLSGNGV